jgi:hypothetical protein
MRILSDLPLKWISLDKPVHLGEHDNPANPACQQHKSHGKECLLGFVG